jgi:hypothetical protein
MTARKPGETPAEPPPKGGRAAERLRQFEEARGLGGGAARPGETPAEAPVPPEPPTKEPPTKEPKKPAR